MWKVLLAALSVQSWAIGAVDKSCSVGQCATRELSTESVLLQRAETSSFTLLDSEILATPSGHPPLCSPVIVDETCRNLRGDDESAGEVPWAVLADRLSAEPESLAAARSALGLPIDEMSVACKELCAAALEYAGKHGVVPPSSDVACRTVRGNTTCDVDVDPDDLARRLGAVQDEELPDKGPVIAEGDQAGDGEPKLIQFTAATEVRGGLGELLRRNLTSGSDCSPISYSVWEVAERVLNLFRVYPSTGRSIVVSWPGVALLQASSTADAEVERKLATREAEAKVWLATVLRELNARRTEQYRNRWFGGAGEMSKEAVRTRILRTMNFIERELAQGLHYVFPANQAAQTSCQGGVVAYVWRGLDTRDKGYAETTYPVCRAGEDPFVKQCALDPQGKYFVYICEYWNSFGRDSQISVLVHEAAHHAGPRDVTYNQQQMQRASQADQLNNAANFQYYAQDIALSATAPAPVPPAPRRPPSPPQGADGQCRDLYGSCGYYQQNGFCANNANVQAQCRKTCGLCGAASSPTPPAPRPVPAPRPPPSPPQGVDGQCRDLYGSCGYYQQNGFCANNANVQAQCRKTCGLCSSPRPAPPPPPPAGGSGSCQDIYGSCGYYKENGFCSTQNVQSQCRKTCGLC